MSLQTVEEREDEMEESVMKEREEDNGQFEVDDEYNGDDFDSDLEEEKGKEIDRDQKNSIDLLRQSHSKFVIDGLNVEEKDIFAGIIEESLEANMIFDIQDSYLDLIRMKSFIQMCICKHRYRKTRSKVIKIQSLIRMFIEQQRYLKMKAQKEKVFSTEVPSVENRISLTEK